MSDVRNCLLCAHCYYSSGEQGFSSVTPGSDAVLECRMKLMRHAKGENLFYEAYTRQQLREALATAETCPEYTPDMETT